MYAQKTTAYIHCSRCQTLTPIHVCLREYDAAQYSCDKCGFEFWVPLDDLRDSSGRRLISHRPLEQPEAEDEE